MSKNKKKKQKNILLEVTNSLIKILQLDAMVFIFLILCIFPFYYQNKYYNMGEAKYLFFRYVSTGCLGIFAALWILSLIIGRKSHTEKRRPSVIDWFVLAYGGTVWISYLFSDYKETALWGYGGWYVGLVTQMFFVLIYFLVSRFWVKNKIILVAGSGVASIVFLLGVMHRFLLDPLELYLQLDSFYYPLFLSTIGQATWYSSYLCTVFSIGLYFYWNGEKTWERIFGGWFTVIGFATMVTQNSDSAFIGFLLILFVFFWFSFSSNTYFKRFLEILLMGLLTFRCIGILQIIFSERTVELEPLSIFASQSPFMMIPLVLIGVFYYFVCKADKGGGWEIQKYQKVRKAFLWVLVASLPISIILIYFVTTGSLESLKGVGYLNFDKYWGNARGFTWMFTADLFLQFPLFNKMFGVGPDCYAPAALDFNHEVLWAQWGNDVLTNAHNEWFTALIFFGIVGLIAYGGIFISGAARFANKAYKEPFLVALTACILGYMGHNFFCYQQVVCTPFIFLFIGMGEGILRKE